MTDYAFGSYHPTPDQIAAAPSLGGHRFAAMEPPIVVDRRGIEYAPILGHNNVYPVCCVVGLCNAMLACQAVNNGSGLPIDQEKIAPFFANVVGIKNTPSELIASGGANPLDVLRAQLRGFDAGLPTPSVGLFGVIKTNRTALANAVDQLRCAYVAIDLYERDMNAMAAGKPWNDLRDPGALVAGHLVTIWDYIGLADGNIARCATWGDLQTFSWEWLDSRIRFAAGIVYRFLGTAGVLDASGDLLEAQLRSMAAAA